MAVRRTEEEMMAIVSKVKPLRMAGKKNREICSELGITYNDLTAALRKLGVYERSIRSENDEDEGTEVVTVNTLYGAQLTAVNNEHAKVKVYTDHKGKKYSDVSEFYGL